MHREQPDGQVLLADQRAASEVLHQVLADTAAAFPAALGGVGFPGNPAVFRRTYPDVMPRFEAARLVSGDRLAIARHAVSGLAERLVWHDAAGDRPLQEALKASAAPLVLQRIDFPAAPGWQPSVVYQGKRWEAAALSGLGEELLRRGVVTEQACRALAWVSEELLDAGTLRLSGRKIAVLGGGAEMAPTRLWLEAGADVLWLDVMPPESSWPDVAGMSGRLYWPAGNADLLTRPQEILATMIDFAGGEPLDLGLYAYAPGRARELRLTGVMNELVNAMPPELVGSVTVLVSPTTPTALGATDLAAMRARREARPGWEAVLDWFGLLGKGGGCTALGEVAASRTVVGIQGASYQAAQYLGKVLVAECWAAEGPPGSARGTPLRVSANTAAITRTRSLDHPVFAAAFGGAAALGVETLTPRQSRRINGLLAVHDWLHPNSPVPGAIRVHGGIHTLPYPLESALRVAAAIGFARSPRLLRGLIGK